MNKNLYIGVGFNVAEKHVRICTMHDGEVEALRGVKRACGTGYHAYAIKVYDDVNLVWTRYNNWLRVAGANEDERKELLLGTAGLLKEYFTPVEKVDGSTFVSD